MGKVVALRRYLAEHYLARQGLKAVPVAKPPSVLHPDVWQRVRNETMTDSARVDAVYEVVRQVVGQGIQGDLVECGVYRGGCSMAMAIALKDADSTDRTIWLYDTFAGMTRPTVHDVRLHDGYEARQKFEATALSENSSDWCAAALETVRANMISTAYPEDRLRFVVGPVEETLETTYPETIAVLRLDTDWYASTRVELETLVPRVSSGGILIVDDYNHWSGSRKAVDEYFARQTSRPIFIPVGQGSVIATLA